MKATPSNYKNIDKSSIEFFNEKGKFSLLFLENIKDNTVHHKYNLDDNYIQLYFSLQGKVKIAFNMEHCAIKLSPEDSGLIYFKDDAMNVLFETPAKGKILGLLIPVPYFHSLFAHEGDSYFNFNNIKGGRPVLEEKVVSPALKIILNQIVAKKLHGSLQDLYIKGKIYELLSLYFNIAEEIEYDH